jgi:hypothetical protein
MAALIRNGVDAIIFLERQHSQTEYLVSSVRRASGPTRGANFFALRWLLALHEAAEGEIVHSAARSRLPNGEALVDSLLVQESEANSLLLELETLNPESIAFSGGLAELEAQLVLHARAEEQRELEWLGNGFDQQRLRGMRALAELAERMPQPHGNSEVVSSECLWSGPYTALLAAARDALYRLSGF